MSDIDLEYQDILKTNVKKLFDNTHLSYEIGKRPNYNTWINFPEEKKKEEIEGSLENFEEGVVVSKDDYELLRAVKEVGLVAFHRIDDGYKSFHFNCESIPNLLRDGEGLRVYINKASFVFNNPDVKIRRFPMTGLCTPNRDGLHTATRYTYYNTYYIDDAEGEFVKA